MSIKFSYFITGTDTEIGKTLVSFILLNILKSKGIKAVGMKPVAAGVKNVKGKLVNEDVEILKKASSVILSEKNIVPYLFSQPIAPHIASTIEKKDIKLREIMKAFNELTKNIEALIVEGVGGFRVPLDDNIDVSDLAKELNLDVILVVGLKLGCLNHALLTADAIKNKGLNLVGWISNQIDPNMLYKEENIDTLKKRLEAPLIGVLPFLKNPYSLYNEKYFDLSKLNSWPN